MAPSLLLSSIFLLILLIDTSSAERIKTKQLKGSFSALHVHSVRIPLASRGVAIWRFTCIYILLQCSTANCLPGGQHRVFGGNKTRRGDLPFIFKLPTDRFKAVTSSGCTAFLIAPRWAMTAAHCHNPPYNETLLVNTPPEVGMRQVRIQQWFRHPNYEFPNGTSNDIFADLALLYLKTAVTDIQPARVSEWKTDPVNDSN